MLDKHGSTSHKTISVIITSAIFFALPAKAQTADLQIKRVGVENKSFSPSDNETVSIGFEITEKADVHVRLYDQLGREVRVITSLNLESGRHEIKWDGCWADGEIAKGKIFLYIIEAKRATGDITIYNRAQETGGHEVKSLDYRLYRDTGNIEYVLPKACMVRIRAGLRDGMFANSLIDWEPQTAGRHKYKWDGKDKSRTINLLKHPQLDLRLTCYTLPDNTIIISEKAVSFESDIKLTDAEEKQRERIWGTRAKCLHYRHNPLVCHQPRFKILFPSIGQTDSNDIPAVLGTVPVRVELDSRDVTHLINTKFEIMIFVDGVFLYEIEEGSSPFTFHWDTSNFAQGTHVLTVNLVSYDDHIGVESRKVILGERS